MSQEPGRVMGIDYGSRRVGVALSDPLRIIAGEGRTLENTPALIEELAGLARENQVHTIVVGVPYSDDGGVGRKAAEVLEFIQKLEGVVHATVETWDESLTSVDARERLLEAGLKKKKRREKGRIDAMAARLILQGFLEHNPAVRRSR